MKGAASKVSTIMLPTEDKSSFSGLQKFVGYQEIVALRGFENDLSF